MMRIGILIDTFNIGGAETMVFELARLVKQSGHEPILIHFGSQYVSDAAASMQVEESILPNHHLYKSAKTLPLFIIKSVFVLRRLSLDCLHSHLYAPITTFSIVCRLLGLRHVGTFHDTYMIEEDFRRAKVVRLAAFLGTKFICVSEPMRNYYVNTVRVKDGCINYIANFSRENIFLPRRCEIRESLNINKEELLVIGVGRLVPLKRFSLFVEAFSMLRHIKGLKAVIIGAGPEESALIKSIRDFGLEDRVALLGERNDVERFLAASDIFCLCSESEGMSKSILEALAAGLPVVATNVGGNVDLVLPENGFLSDLHTAEQIASFINVLASDVELRNSMSRASLKLLNDRYGEARFIESHLKLYKGV